MFVNPSVSLGRVSLSLLSKSRQTGQVLIKANFAEDAYENIKNMNNYSTFKLFNTNKNRKKK